MATTETWTDRGGQRQERTEWHRCVLWGKMAESLQEYLVKGKQIAVEGRLQTREWEKDGVKRYSTEIRADRVVLLGGGNGGGPRRERPERQARRRAEPADDDVTPVGADLGDDSFDPAGFDE